jgi:hypothetical protein
MAKYVRWSKEYKDQAMATIAERENALADLYGKAADLANPDEPVYQAIRRLIVLAYERGKIARA